MGLFHVAYNGYVWKGLFPYRHPERSRGIFLAYWYSVLCETAEKGKPSAKGARKSRVQGRFLAAPLMTVWGNGFIPRSVQRICLENAIPVSSSRAKPSIFLAYWYSVLCETAEKGKPSAKGARKSRVQGRFLAAPLMTVWGNGFIPRSVQRICLENAIPVSSSRAKPSIFLAYWYSVLCETAEKGKPSAKGARKSRVQGRFLAALEMTVWGNGFISRSVQRICLESAIPVSSSRAKSRDLSCTSV